MLIPSRLMIYLFACILCTFSLGLIFKVLNNKNHSVFSIILVNYLICSCIGLIKMKTTLNQIDPVSLNTGILIGLLFIIGFNVFGLSIQKSGLGITSLVQKLSVIATVIASLFLGEVISYLKYFGLLLSLIALYLLFVPENNEKSKTNYFTYLLLLSFCIASCIEIAFLVYNKNKNVIHDATQFTTIVFFSSAFFGLIYYFIKLRSIPTKYELVWGAILGIPNYFSIEFLNLSLESGMHGSIFFPILNISVILLSGISGYLIFKEKFSRRQIWGYLFAFMSIAIISLNQ